MRCTGCCQGVQQTAERHTRLSLRAARHRYESYHIGAGFSWLHHEDGLNVPRLSLPFGWGKGGKGVQICASGREWSLRRNQQFVQAIEV